MSKIISPSHFMASIPIASAADVAALHQTCSEIEAAGGELGFVARDIRRISDELLELNQRIDSVLDASAA